MRLPFIKDWFSESKQPVLNSLRIGFSLLMVPTTQSVSGYVSHESGFSKRVLQPGHVCRESFSRTRHLIDINETTRCAWVALARSRSRARAYVIDYSQRGYHPCRVLLLAQAGAHACAISRALACPWNYNGRQPVPTAVWWCTYAAIPSNAGDNDAELNEATQIRLIISTRRISHTDVRVTSTRLSVYELDIDRYFSISLEIKSTRIDTASCNLVLLRFWYLLAYVIK